MLLDRFMKIAARVMGKEQEDRLTGRKKKLDWSKLSSELSKEDMKEIAKVMAKK
ncbi:hypothetical protein JCM14036_02670 [Desulfotomaculum defluvii]